ncbi:Peroxidase 47 [Apostasia shenzhenica]|uniref:Peroxidase n=1 Tax=Apostasia shenzhenica TaxID=1088818 RepID=A0A2I0A2Z6_9ASPA|nr:Peroxidase 47 [Apostasia shenzhenica]
MIFCAIPGLFLTVWLLIAGDGNALSIGYYGFECPMAEAIVKSTVEQALRKDPTLAAGLLRMHFHDCFVQGCDGSVLIDSTKDNTAEKDSPANLSLRGYEVIDKAKQLLEGWCPGVVSCADILAMAARDAVFFAPNDLCEWREQSQESSEQLQRTEGGSAGGPVYEIPKGRKDGRRSRIEDTINLPPPTLNVSGLIRMFAQHGFSAQEMVVLSGGHTLGVARCSSFKQRLSKFDSTHDVDPSIDSSFGQSLAMKCSAGDTTEVAFDASRNTFDSAYFKAIQTSMGLLFSDQTLSSSPRTRVVVNAYAMNQALFFFDFQKAMVKMGLLDVKEDDEGDVRLNCRKIN